MQQRVPFQCISWREKMSFHYKRITTVQTLSEKPNHLAKYGCYKEKMFSTNSIHVPEN